MQLQATITACRCKETNGPLPHLPVQSSCERCASMQAGLRADLAVGIPRAEMKYCGTVPGSLHLSLQRRGRKQQCVHERQRERPGFARALPSFVASQPEARAHPINASGGLVGEEGRREWGGRPVWSVSHKESAVLAASRGGGGVAHSSSEGTPVPQR